MRIVRNFLWRILGLSYSKTLRIHDYVFINEDPFTKIGEKTYHNGAMIWRWTNAPLILGNYCSIANNVRFIVDEGFHKLSQITNYPLVNNLYKEEISKQFENDKTEILKNKHQKSGIKIGNDVWIGMNCLIMPGVNIGNGVTVAANSVVTKDIADYSVVAGIPAKIMYSKLDEMQICEMNKIKWWEWGEDVIKKRINDFYELSPGQFIEKYRK